jgi:hypothetical protein
MRRSAAAVVSAVGAAASAAAEGMGDDSRALLKKAPGNRGLCLWVKLTIFASFAVCSDVFERVSS